MNLSDLIIYTDIDGTATTTGRDKKIVPANNINALKYFISKGGYFGVASGRNHNSIKAFFPDVSINMPYVEANGAYIYDDEKKYFSQTCVNNKVIKELYDYAINKQNLFVTIMDEEGTKRISYGDERDSIIIDFERPFLSIEYCMQNRFAKCALLGNKEDIDNALNDINIFKTRSMFKISQSAPIYVEIFDKDVNKAVGISKAIDFKKLNDKKLVCIGDYYNDLEMLENADIAICPSNSVSDIKNVCDYISVSNDEGCLADAINYLERI